jgi:hypothetical protein
MPSDWPEPNIYTHGIDIANFLMNERRDCTRFNLCPKPVPEQQVEGSTGAMKCPLARIQSADGWSGFQGVRRLLGLDDIIMGVSGELEGSLDW